jgi:acetyl-CoA C-acetyltransferase
MNSLQISSRDAVIVGAARTPTGRFMGGLSQFSAPELGAFAVRAATERAGIDPATIDEVVLGHVVAAGVGQAPARQATLKAGLDPSIGAFSVNKVCGSGLKAVMLAANAIRAGEADVMVAGGMESMSQAPHILPGGRSGLRYGHTQMQDAILHDGLWCSFENQVMGDAADFIARHFDLTREALDAFALQSHTRAAEATAAGRFSAEITPVTVPGKRGSSTVIVRDEPIRATWEGVNGYTVGTTLEQLGKLPPAFSRDGIVTAGNAPGLNDGGSALVVTSMAAAQAQGLTPLARIVGYTHAAVEPKWIFAAPARAIPRLLQRIGWQIGDVDLFEINEAFAAQVLANAAELARNGMPLDMARVNVNGGAIALGHPIGSSGARLLVTLLHALQQRNLRRGVAALCLGGGEAVALAIELP